MGVKRKLSDIDRVEDQGNYSEQRQSILNISMCKLKTSPIKRVEPSLRRSVLIFNTLRNIEDELKDEGVRLYSTAKPLLPSIESNDSMTLDPIPNTTDTTSVIQASTQLENLTVKSSDDTCAKDTPHHHPMDVVLSSGASCKDKILPGLDSIFTSFNLSAIFEEEINSNILPNMSTSPSVYSSSGASVTATVTTFAGAVTQACNNRTVPTSLFPNLTSQKPEDPLGDIDMNLCDFDLFTPLAPSVRISPVSAEELARSLPTNEATAAAMLCSEPSSCGASIGYKNELLHDELDHIMQVLVGM